VANAIALADVPAGLTARQAVDWHNGKGVYQGRGRIDNYRLAIYWNWLTILDNVTGLEKLAPPTIGALRALGFTFTADFPWYAAAGMTRGLLPDVVDIQYGKISSDVRQAMYGNGNSVNPIFRQNGQIMVWGDRTMQVAESKLVEIHAVNLVNNIVVGLGNIGRRFVFEPNDSQLLTLINLSFGQFLDGIKNQRGLEAYKLVVDSTNNTPTTRNKHQVIVDLAIIPTDVAETIFINVTVNASGAQLNTVTT
jgi:phage tail sheath protein FI